MRTSEQANHPRQKKFCQEKQQSILQIDNHLRYCTLGCGSAEKQGPVISFLPDAGKAGAKFIEGFEAEKIIFDTINGKKSAVAVKGLWRSRDTSGSVSGSDRTSRTVIIKAKRVIVSAGSLQSPLLLLRSGLKNPQIGRNLYLHPGENSHGHLV